MFKLKKTRIYDTDWKVFNSIEEPTLVKGDIIRLNDSTGTFKVTNVHRKEVGSYQIFLELIIPGTFPLRKTFELFHNQKYRLIGKS